MYNKFFVFYTQKTEIGVIKLQLERNMEVFQQ